MRDFEKNHVVLAVDFDGTICTENYPEIGREREGAKEIINKLYEEGYAIVINTCRSNINGTDAAGMAKDFLRIRGIKYDSFNNNLNFLIDLYEGDCRKISADVYIDDKCLFNPIPSWENKYSIIKDRYPNPYDKYDKVKTIPIGSIKR